MGQRAGALALLVGARADAGRAADVAVRSVAVACGGEAELRGQVRAQAGAWARVKVTLLASRRESTPRRMRSLVFIVLVALKTMSAAVIVLRLLSCSCCIYDHHGTTVKNLAPKPHGFPLHLSIVSPQLK